MTDSARDVRRIVDDIVVQHDSFYQMQMQMDSLWRDAEARIPIVAPFFGETGTGKTTAIRTFAKRHPPHRTPDGRVTPILLVNTPSKPTPKSLAEQILWLLGDPRPTAGSAASKLYRIVTLLAACQVRMLALDDVQHFVDKRQQILLFEASDYLKELLLSYDLVLLCLGLPESELLIQSNEQLKTRSKAIFELRRFDWEDEASQDQFVAVLAEFRRKLEGFDLPDLTSPELSLRMYLATGGLIRYVSAIMSKALRNAIDRGTKKIRLQDLASAWSEEIVGAKTEYPDPFARSFALNDLANKLALARTIGQRAARPSPKRARKPSAVLAEVGL